MAIVADEVAFVADIAVVVRTRTLVLHGGGEFPSPSCVYHETSSSSSNEMVKPKAPSLLSLSLFLAGPPFSFSSQIAAHDDDDERRLRGFFAPRLLPHI